MISSGNTELWKIEKPLLQTLDMELTERCNNDCIHCYINRSAGDSECMAAELTLREISDILLQAAALGCLTVRFTGGEPLLRDDFPDIYRVAGRLGMQVELMTNATLITPDIAALLETNPPGMPVEVTLYGMTPETETAVTRRPGAFEAVREGIALLDRHKVPYYIRWTALPQNMHELPLFESMARRTNRDEPAPLVTTSLNLRARRDSETKNERIRGLRLSPEERLALLTREPAAYRRDMMAYWNARQPRNGRLFECGAGRSGCVDAYGKYQMCMLLRHPDTIYDLKSGTLEDALTRFFPEVRKRSATNPEYLARCARCDIIDLCDQCPAKSWMESGTLDTPVEYLCECARIEAEYLGIKREDSKQ